jgi:hypothetical protein
VITSSARHNFSDLQLAYLWAKEESGLNLDPNIREGRIGNWSYVSFDCLRTWMNEDPISGYRVFKRRYDPEYYTEYLIYYDIPQQELDAHAAVQVVLPNQNAFTNDEHAILDSIVESIIQRFGQPVQIPSQMH